MKILFTVEFYEPQKGGAEEVVKQLAERLAVKGNQVTVATTAIAARDFAVLRGVRVAGFDIRGSHVRGIAGDESEIKRYQEFLLGDFDVIVNYATQIWTTDLAFPILGAIRAKKVLVSCGYTRKNEAYEAYFQKMPEYLNQYDKLVYMSSAYHDKEFAGVVDLEHKAVIIPNAAAAEEFLAPDTFDIKKQLGVSTPYLLICISNHYLAKGHRFVIDAFKKMNRADATLLIVGEIPSVGIKKLAHFILGCYRHCFLASLFNKHIRISSGKNRDLVLSAYKQADLFLFGSKIECAPLVMYESFASRTPFITTDVGNVKDHKEYLQIVASPEEMAAHANALLDDMNLRHALADRAYTLWKEHHTWDAVALRYEELFNQLHDAAH